MGIMRRIVCPTTFAAMAVLLALTGLPQHGGSGGDRTVSHRDGDICGLCAIVPCKEKGFFGDLDVQLTRIEEVPSIRAAMARKDVEAYLATPDIALDTNSAPPGRAIWAIDESAGGDGVIVGEGLGDNIAAFEESESRRRTRTAPEFPAAVLSLQGTV